MPWKLSTETEKVPLDHLVLFKPESKLAVPALGLCKRCCHAWRAAQMAGSLPFLGARLTVKAF